MSATHTELVNALLGLVQMIDKHRAIYGYEKQHYVMDEGPEWAAARAVLKREMGVFVPPAIDPMHFGTLGIDENGNVELPGDQK